MQTKLLPIIIFICKVAVSLAPEHSTDTLSGYVLPDANICEDTFGMSSLYCIPDYYQEDTSYGGFPGGGKMYCGPVAVSNSLIAILSGYLTKGNMNVNIKEYQYQLITDLASPKCMGTGPLGSSASNICYGVQRYLSKKGFKDFTISYYGWRSVPSRFRLCKIADMNVLKTISFNNKETAWINIGWYVYNKNDNSYNRRGGHWVTYIDLCGSTDLKMVIHDPATQQQTNDTISLKFNTGGVLTGTLPGLPVDAAGYYYYQRKNGAYAFIDGFVILKIESPADHV